MRISDWSSDVCSSDLTTPAAVEVLKSFCDRGECRIGAHLHPWVNPPHREVVNAVNSYPGNLPPELERAKLTALTQEIGRASCRERVWQYVWITVVAVALKTITNEKGNS